MHLTPQQVNDFQRTVWDFYQANKRDMPWRHSPTPYHVFVSEIMLQQTQVSRVIPKFEQFVARFPNFKTLANAGLSDVLAQWSGLGYNRRAKFLWQAAQQIMRQHDGQIPDSALVLTTLPGIGPNTAGAIMAYAFDRPIVFIETNIRTVLIYHFYADQPGKVTDPQLREVASQVLPADNSREWHWALMDYGTHLKTTAGAQLHKVHGHRPQSKFAGSRRQIRGQVLRLLLAGRVSAELLRQQILDPRLPEVLAALQAEGLITHTNRHWHLT